LTGWTGRRIFKELADETRRRKIAAAFWRYGDATSKALATVQLAKALRFREERKVGGGYDIAISRRQLRPKLCIFDALAKAEGAGKAGCPRHPQSCARMHMTDRRCAGTPGLPCAVVLTAYGALPGDEFVLPPSLTD